MNAGTWSFLVAAIIAEVAATTLLKASDGFSHLLPTLGVIAGYVASFIALGAAFNRGLDLGIGYAIWAGLGSCLVVASGMWLFHERLTATLAIGLVMIVSGVVVVHLGQARAA